MNIPTLICAILVTSLLPSVCDIPWTYSIEEGEDASSSHYYFYQERHESIERIRWVWNGGAQNAPTVTDYILSPGKSTVRPLVGKRESLPKLTKGGDVELELKDEYAISTSDPTAMLVLPAPGKALSYSQRMDLTNLFNFLAKNRKHVPASEEKVAPPQDHKPAKE
ncbi:MAG: hypothetical protein ACJA16_005508 [Akkermansiaceae bacterium]|jgi:hypothetical protein